MSGSTRQASFKNQAISCSVPAVIASAATMLAAIAAGAAPPRRLSEATPGIAELSFFGATISKSNLGGYGPDSGEENLRFEGVGQTASGFSIDLVVTALDGYEPYNTERTMINGMFGRESPLLKHSSNATHTPPSLCLLRLSRPSRHTQRSTFWRSARRRCSSASRRRAAAATASRSTPSPSSSTTSTTAAPPRASGCASATTRRTPPRRRSTRPSRRSSRSAPSTTAAPSSTQRRRASAATTRSIPTT